MPAESIDSETRGTSILSSSVEKNIELSFYFELLLVWDYGNSLSLALAGFRSLVRKQQNVS